MEKKPSPAPDPENPARILVVDDELKIRDSLARGLRKSERWHVETAARGSEAQARLAETSFDLLVLDWMLPDCDGLEILRQVREQRLATAVLMLTARDGLADRVNGIDSGADDYLVKPFAFEELLARCRALIRRRRTPAAAVLRCADLELEPRGRVARRAGEEVPLTPLEAELLEYLMVRPHLVVTREMLARDIWRGPLDSRMTNTIYIHIARLRQKVDSGGAATLIHTVAGLGYRFGVEPA